MNLCHISHVSGPILTKVSVHIHVNLRYHPVISNTESESANWKKASLVQIDYTTPTWWFSYTLNRLVDVV